MVLNGPEAAGAGEGGGNGNNLDVVSGGEFGSFSASPGPKCIYKYLRGIQ